MFNRIYLGETPINKIYEGDKNIINVSNNYILDPNQTLNGIPSDVYRYDRIVFKVKNKFTQEAQGKRIHLSGVIYAKDCISLPDGRLPNGEFQWCRIGGELRIDYTDGTTTYNAHFKIDYDRETMKYKDTLGVRVYGYTNVPDKPIKSAEAYIYIQGLKSGTASVSKALLTIGPHAQPWEELI